MYILMYMLLSSFRFSSEYVFEVNVNLSYIILFKVHPKAERNLSRLYAASIHVEYKYRVVS